MKISKINQIDDREDASDIKQEFNIESSLTMAHIRSTIYMKTEKRKLLFFAITILF